MMSLMDNIYLKFATPATKRILALLMEPHAEWKNKGGYYLTLDNPKISIWIANKAYGLRVETWCDWPGLGSEWRPPFADRHLIWRRVRQMRPSSPEMFKQERVLAALTVTNSPEPQTPNQ